MRSSISIAALAMSAIAGAAATHHFSMTGSYVEGCSCPAPCPCEMASLAMGCQGVGAFNFTGGSFEGKSLAGIRAAYATKPGEWVTIYVDASTPAKRATGMAFMRAAMAGWGKIESVKEAKIAVWHKGNKDFCTVDGGKIMDLESDAMLGQDGKTPMCYSNIHDPMHPIVMQGKLHHCSFKDGDKEFKLKDTNAFFNHSIRSSGKV